MVAGRKATWTYDAHVQEPMIELISSSSSSCANYVADIGDHGLPILSVVSSPDELIVGRFFSSYEIIQTVCVLCALPSSAFGTTETSELSTGLRQQY